MEEVKIKLSALWTARMLDGFLGDVLRFFEPGMMKQITAGEVDGMKMTHDLLLFSAIVMTIPIFMVFLSLTLKHKANRLANIIVAALLFGFDLIGLPSYTFAYAIFLIVVGLVFNALTVWYAWGWRPDSHSPSIGR